MKTKQVFSPTKEKLLKAAQELMLRKGFPSTTLDDICEKARVTKGSFFHYFESKEALGKDVLEYYMAQSQRELQAASFNQKNDPLQRVYGFIDFVIQRSQAPGSENGCLLGTFAQELSDMYPAIRSLCAQKFGVWSDIFKSNLDQAQSMYTPDRAINTQSLAEHFTATIQGSFILVKAKQDKTIVKKTLEHFRAYVQTLFER